MTKHPLVSVIIPTYNRAGIITRTIDNVLEQTYRDFELIIVDDGSSDDTQGVLRQYGDRIRVISQANSGPAVARNRGVEAAHGEIIAFQDSDDAWLPMKLARQVALLEKADPNVPCCICNADFGIVCGKPLTSFGSSLLYPEHPEGLWTNVGDVLATRFLLFNQCVAIRRTSFESVGGFNAALKYLEDYDLPLRLALEGPWAFIRDPQVTYGGTTDGSFSHQALKDPITLKQCELEIFGQMLERTNNSIEYRRMPRFLRRRIRRFQFGLLENRLRNANVPGAKTTAAIMERVAHYDESLFRRSPWFPRMMTASL